MMVLVVTRFMEVAWFAPTLAGMIGLGVVWTTPCSC
jgi:hypothetical protein